MNFAIRPARRTASWSISWAGLRARRSPRVLLPLRQAAVGRADLLNRPIPRRNALGAGGVSVEDAGFHLSRLPCHLDLEATRLVEIDAGPVQDHRRQVVGLPFLFLREDFPADVPANVAAHARSRLRDEGAVATAA